MRKVLFPLLLILLFSACKKETSPELLSAEITDAAAKRKIAVCHYDNETGTSHTITINANALDAHLAHGDLLGDCSAVLVTICDQDWMVKNLDVDTYRNGDPIPQVTDQAEWASLTTGAWCYQNNDQANGAIYGKLYNWYAVNDPRGLTPAGWHIPSNTEWTTIETCLGGASVAGGAMKEAGTTHWFPPNTLATNSSGFTGLPGGWRSNVGSFSLIRYYGFWWSSSEQSSTFAYNRYLRNDGSILSWGNFLKKGGFSVRCVRD